MDIRETSRGFPYTDFVDRYNQKCSIQDSSLATEAAIWLGVDVDVNGVEVGSRMHLTQDFVRDELIPVLQRFSETSSIGGSESAREFLDISSLEGNHDTLRDAGKSDFSQIALEVVLGHTTDELTMTYKNDNHTALYERKDPLDHPSPMFQLSSISGPFMIGDFKIGDEFTYPETSDVRRRVTDVGSRTLTYITLDKGDDTSWYNGPPYAVAEHVADEDSLESMIKYVK